MSKIEEALWDEYHKITKQIESMNVQTEGYIILLEKQDNIRNELIKLEQIDQESNTKLLQIKSEDKREMIRNGITLFTFAATFVGSLYGMHKTFKFDEVSTVTSTMGRNILNGFIPRLFKK